MTENKLIPNIIYLKKTMKKLFALLMACFTLAPMNAQEKNVIRITTDNTDLILQVAPNGRLYQAYLGDKLLNERDIDHFSPYVKSGSSHHPS